MARYKLTHKASGSTSEVDQERYDRIVSKGMIGLFTVEPIAPVPMPDEVAKGMKASKKRKLNK